ncbi:MAG TPA: 50S ribosomal protein L4 [Acidimicrobiales bacterium]|nr:50S ribosomal protein L4 [Acidimicrobiales bacterium]
MSLQLDVRGMDGTIKGTVTLDDEFFAAQPNVPVLHQVVTAQLAAARAGTQSTKTRAEVSGGGAKPFKQKGTGRARQGSTRAPHYSGGGIALGPKPRNYRQRTPKKMVQLALRGALSDRAGSGRVMVVESWDFEIPNTKAARTALEALGVDGRALIVLSREDQLAYKSLRNLPDVDLVLASELAAYDVLCSDWLVFSRRTLPGQSAWAEAPPPAPTPQAKPARASGQPRARAVQAGAQTEAVQPGAQTEAGAGTAAALRASSEGDPGADEGEEEA